MLKYLYHSSSKKQDVLMPQELSEQDKKRPDLKEYWGKKVIFAASKIDFSLSFGAFSGKVTWSLQIEGDEVSYVRIEDLDWEDNINFDDKLFLHYVKPDSFTELNGFEWLSLESVTVVKVEAFTVKDIFEKFPVYTYRRYKNHKK